MFSIECVFNRMCYTRANTLSLIRSLHASLCHCSTPLLRPHTLAAPRTNWSSSVSSSPSACVCRHTQMRHTQTYANETYSLSLTHTHTYTQGRARTHTSKAARQHVLVYLQINQKNGASTHAHTHARPNAQIYAQAHTALDW